MLTVSLKTITLVSSGGLGETEALVVVAVRAGVPFAVGRMQVPGLLFQGPPWSIRWLQSPPLVQA